MGPPGSGKGTQASYIADRFGIDSISTGDLFRDNLSRDTELGRLAKRYMEKGEYVPDQVTIDIVMRWIESPDNNKGFVLDGFPRTIAQAEALDQGLRDLGGIDRVIFFDAKEDLLVERLSGRLICSSCQASYNLVYSPPASQGECDSCKGNLYQRDDDKSAVVRNRLCVYMRETEPVVQFFRASGTLREIDASLSISEVRDAVEDAVR
jgi:adenylate kinase